MRDDQPITAFETVLTRRRALAASVGLAGLIVPHRTAEAFPADPIRVSGTGWIPIEDRSRATFNFFVFLLPPSPILPPNPIRGFFEFHNRQTGFWFLSLSLDTLIISGNTASFGGLGRGGGNRERQRFDVEVTGGGAGSTFSFVGGGTEVSGSIRGGGIAIVGETEGEV